MAAAAIVALAPAPETFRCGRDFSAWLGLAPKQSSSGGKEKLGRITKMGERKLRRPLTIGPCAVIKQASLRGAPAGSCCTNRCKVALIFETFSNVPL